MPFKIRVDVDSDLINGLKNIAIEVRDKVLDQAITEAAEITVAEARRLAPEETGLLRRSIIRVLRGGSRGSYVIIGPKSNFSGPGPDGRTRVPANYAHLVEFGHAKVKPVKGTSIRKKTATSIGFVPAKPFLRPAIENTRLQVRASLVNSIKAFHAKFGRAA